jgi:RimJ/RimL family protein N-acetyltransferase
VPAFPHLHHPLSDGAVALRPSAERDIPEVLIAYQDDPKLHLKLGEARPPSGAELGRRAERADARLRAGEALTLTILESGSDLARGEVRVGSVDWERRRAELAIWVAPQRRGRGIARRALALASAWLLGEAGLERVVIRAAPGDRALIAAARAAGFLAADEGHDCVPERKAATDEIVLSRARSDLSA